MSRTTVITGAASGIGASLAEVLGERGDRVIGVDLAGTEVEADLSTAEGRATMVDRVDALSGGHVDGVVANAGVLGSSSPLVLQVNFFGAVATLEGLRPLLARSEEPRAVATCSAALLHTHDAALVNTCLAGNEGAALAHVEEAELDPVTTYASTKRALARWVRARAVENGWAGAGIALNAVAPGVIRTPMTAAVLADEAGAAVLLEMLPMPLGGVAEPAAVAHLIAFLTSAGPSAMSGQVLFVDGGGECLTRGDDIWGQPG